MRKYQLSQHFLKSPRKALELIGHSNIKKHDIVLDIGAGSGVITTALAKRAKFVVAVEKDHDTAVKLRKNLRNFENVKIIEADILKVDLNKIFEGEKFKVFANPPFDISSDTIRKLMEVEPEAIYLILQKQFALKLLNNGRHYTSQLGQALTTRYQTRIRFPLKPWDFTPPPAVPTVLFEAKKII